MYIRMLCNVYRSLFASPYPLSPWYTRVGASINVNTINTVTVIYYHTAVCVRPAGPSQSQQSPEADEVQQQDGAGARSRVEKNYGR